MWAEDFLKRLFDEAVRVADPMRSVAQHLPPRPRSGRVLVLGAGKASARMAEAVEAAWGPCEGLVITRYGHGRPCQGIEVIEAGHPVPDAAGLRATERMLQRLEGLGAGDLVLVLISGGASALLCAPVEGVSLAEKQAVNGGLLASGAPIGQMNLLRKHLSRVKGGQLAAAAYPAEVLCLMISDVPGDDPGVIGSGPTVGEGSSLAEARGVLRDWGIAVSPGVWAALSGQERVIRPDDPRLGRVVNRVIAAPGQSLAAAKALAEAEGCRVEVLGDRIEGEARDVARAMAGQVLELAARRGGDGRPLLLLSGGELTVTRRGEGIGGPNAEFSLALALALQGARGVYALACDTDGVDGAAEVAGAVIGPDTLKRARALGLDAERALAENDAHRFFGALGAQVVTGPTLTNVNDFRAILVT